MSLLLLLQAPGAEAHPVTINMPASSPLQSLFTAVVGGIIAAAIGYYFNWRLDGIRTQREDDRRTTNYKALVVLVVLELVYIHERCVQYVVQATGLANGTKDGGISKSFIYLQQGPGQLERLQTLGADWRIARAGYTVYEIAGQVQRQLDKIPADYMGSFHKTGLAENYFAGIAAFVDQTIYEEKLLRSVQDVLDIAKTILPAEFIKDRQAQVDLDRKKHDAIRPPKQNS